MTCIHDLVGSHVQRGPQRALAPAEEHHAALALHDRVPVAGDEDPMVTYIYMCIYIYIYIHTHTYKHIERDMHYVNSLCSRFI